MPSTLASTFGAQALLWHDFYSLAGTASATLLGLLFVSMSLHADPAAIGRQFEVERRIWDVAGGALATFADVLLLALVLLVPNQTALGGGLPVLILGVLAFLIVLLVALSARTVVSSTRSRWSLSAPPLLGCLLQALAGAGIVTGQPAWLDVLAAATGVLLSSALIASWLLLSGPVLVTIRRSSPPETPSSP